MCLGELGMIFTDAGYCRGLFDKKDPHHKDSLEIKKFLDESIQLPRPNRGRGL